MKRGDYLGMPVRLVEGRNIPIEYLPGAQMLDMWFTTEDVFTVERDFRDSEEDGIRVGCPNGSWLALTGGQFAEMFGAEVLATLDAIRYEGGDER